MKGNLKVELSKPPLAASSHRKTSEHVPSPTRLELVSDNLDGCERALVKGKLLFKSESLCAAEDRVEGFAFMRTTATKFEKLFLTISDQEKTLSIQFPSQANFCGPIHANNMQKVSEASDLTRASHSLFHPSANSESPWKFNVRLKCIDKELEFFFKNQEEQYIWLRALFVHLKVKTMDASYRVPALIRQLYDPQNKHRDLLRITEAESTKFEAYAASESSENFNLQRLDSVRQPSSEHASQSDLERI